MVHTSTLLALGILTCCASITLSINTGFWYGGDRGPLYYDSLPYTNLTVKINRPFQEGPGQQLFTDPEHPSRSIYVGNTINRQSFDTQFVLDLEYALGLSADRIYVTQVIKGDVHFSWESSSVIVYFMLLERNGTENTTLVQSIAKLQALIQTSTSKIYHGTNVTNSLDPLYGLQVVSWDVSLKLTYSIESIGGSSVIDNYYLNYGGLGFCDDSTMALTYTQYCEFERFFEDDISKALDIAYYRIQILFIKKASLDSVLIHFRILPPPSNEPSIEESIMNLLIQVPDQTSSLYYGNVTIRTDPVWGVSGTFPSGINGSIPLKRNLSALFTLKYYDYDIRHLFTSRVRTERRPPPFVTPYDRCKANRRCNWGIVVHNQSTNEANYFHRLFDLGTLFPTQLFLDFEDWRFGARGFTWDGNVPPTQHRTQMLNVHANAGEIRGAHFWPFSTRALGPDVPSFLTERNQGLVLDRQLQHKQMGFQEALVFDLQGRLGWIEENIEVATMDAKLRARKDVRRYMTGEQGHFHHWFQNELEELRQLNSSQCAHTTCVIHFDTTTLRLTGGTIHDTGVLQLTSEGTEVAVFNFNSIYLGPEVKVVLTGQRPLALTSRTAAIINCTIQALPGTIGGFLGGYSVSRLYNETLSDHPRDVLMCSYGKYCLNSNYTEQGQGVPLFSDKEQSSLDSYNVNGPGSGNLFVYPFLIKSSATFLPELQVIQTSAQSGQTLAGGFIVSYGAHSTPIIPHDASADHMKKILEENLNIQTSSDSPINSNRYYEGIAGIGIVNVTRTPQDTQEGFKWSITFMTAIGNIPQLTIVSYLKALHANVNVTTLIQGNQILGSFVINFQNYSTQPIFVNDSASIMKSKLLALPPVQTAFVDRIDPTGNCGDGLCENSPLSSSGMVWTVYLGLDSVRANISPTSPSGALKYTVDMIHSLFTIDTSNITGIGAAVQIQWGLAGSRGDMYSLLNIPKPFALAFGGAGGSYGGIGGKGYGDNVPGRVYGSRKIPDLLGGSGGCLRGQYPFDSNAFLGKVAGRGGHGGGAIEIVAATDIVIGSFGKIIVAGGDAEQTSEGGGGGGSGGAIVLAAGGTVTVEGTLDASGGHGGYGGNKRSLVNDMHVSQAGGGGGGGRIAIYAESVTSLNESHISVTGGACGVLKITANVSVSLFNFTVEVWSREYLDQLRVSYLTEVFINKTFNPLAVYYHETSAVGQMDTYYLYFTLAFDILTSVHDLYERGVGAVGFLIGDVEMVNFNISMNGIDKVLLPNHISMNCNNNGSDGTIFTESTMTTSMYVRRTDGAEGTTSALFLSNNETTNTTSGSSREAPFPWNGPILPFQPANPTRITFYTKLDAVPGESTKAQFSALFSVLSRGEPLLNVTSVIGVSIGERFKHGSNFGQTPDEHLYLERLTVIERYPVLNRWYKIDIRLRWDLLTYSILVDDVLEASGQKFVATQIDGIRLAVNRAVNVWFDEIYVGFDNAMRFECPITSRAGTTNSGPNQRGWDVDEVDTPGSSGYDELYPMTRHYNFLPDVDLVKFDGQGLQKVYENIKQKFSDGDYPIGPAKLHAGALKYLKGTSRSMRVAEQNSATSVTRNGLWANQREGSSAGDGRYFWYIEHNHNESHNLPRSTHSHTGSYLDGGIASCSTQDMLEWRFEGIVLHYTNLSDMVYGTASSFSLERPTVIFNKNTQEYVMYATMNDPSHELGLSAVSSSLFEDGPFLFRRSMYPDGNRTRDQIAFINDESRAVLGRTYYVTIEYLMPEAVMQPVWESVKFNNGSTHYSLNYHRAFYHLGYDNFHDIYLQRWRLEDKPWNVSCVNKITKERRYVPINTHNIEGDVCNNPGEYKVVIGQGSPYIPSRYLSPDESENSWWIQTSVPAVKAQPWANNYVDGFCGIKKLDDDHDILDPELEQFTPTDRGKCSNIPDNPLHEALQDKLIGVMRIVTSRRAKYIAVSELTDDFLDTTGVLTSIEGELDSGHLISMMTSMGQFGFGAGNNVKSTFHEPKRSEYRTAYDYKIRFRQFISNYNDRAQYALACVLDGICSVNYRDQLTKGQM